jgi:peptide deformylase
MAILRIARMGHPVLRQVAEPVPPEQIQEPAFQALIDDMLDTLQDYEGAGLAAPQVHVSLRVIALVAEPPQPGADASPAPEPMVLINPEITFLTPDLLRSYEGCLSVPGLRAAVNRVGKVEVRALDRLGAPLSFELEGFPAIAVQHECDHLDGVLYVDRCDLQTLTFLDELRRFGPLDPSFRQGDPEPGDQGSEPPTGPAGGGEPDPPREPRSGARAPVAPAQGHSAAPLVMAGGPRAES